MGTSGNWGVIVAGGFYDVLVAQEAATAVRAQQGENTSRWAVSLHVVETRGNVRMRATQPIVFETPFYEPPSVTTGVAIKKDFAPGAEWLPSGSAGIYQWQRNPKGHYTGAFYFVAVSNVEAMSEIEHHFVFSGVAYKNLGQEVAADAQTLLVRPVGFGGL